MIFSLIADAVKTGIGFFKEKSAAKHSRNMAKIQNEERLLKNEHEANSEWTMANLTDKDKILRYAAFVLFASPLIASFVSPELGQRVQAAWHSLPEWQSNVLSGMCLSVFGMKAIPQLIASTVGGIKQALKK